MLMISLSSFCLWHESSIQLEDQNDENKAQKLEFEIAKYLKSKLPPKRTTLLAHKVDYFIGKCESFFSSVFMQSYVFVFHMPRW